MGRIMGVANGAKRVAAGGSARFVGTIRGKDIRASIEGKYLEMRGIFSVSLYSTQGVKCRRCGFMQKFRYYIVSLFLEW